MKKICILMALSLLFWLAPRASKATSAIRDSQTWLVKCAHDDCMLVSSKHFRKRQISRIRLYNVGNQQILDFLLPLGFSIKEGVFLKIDDHPALPTRIVVCEEKGCTGFLATSQKIVRNMMKGRNISLIFTGFPDRKQYVLNYTLMGFTKAYKQTKGKYQ